MRHYDLQSARKRHGFVLLQHPRWKIHRKCHCFNCTPRWTPPCVSFMRQLCVCVCWRVRVRRVKWQRWTSGLVAGVYLQKRPKEVEGRKVTLSQSEITLLVCHTSALLSNPHTELLIIPPCCSPFLCLFCHSGQLIPSVCHSHCFMNL